MSALWLCEICHYRFTFVPLLDENGNLITTRPKECPRCKVPDVGVEGTLDSLDG